MTIITTAENIKRIVLEALIEDEYQKRQPSNNTSYNDIANAVIRKLTETITGYQEWYEDTDSKTGWWGTGWFDKKGKSLEDYELVEYTESDKHYNPIEATFKLKAE